MAHHRNFAADQSAYRLDAACTSFELYGVSPSLQTSAGIANRLLGTEMKAEKRHISHDQCARLCAYDGFQMMVHHHHANRQSVIES